MTLLPRILLILCLLAIALLAWGMLQPSHYNWGLHFLTFYDPVIAALLLLFSLSLLFEPVRRTLIRLAEKVIQPLSSLPVWAGVLLVSSVLVAAALVFPSRGSLLGDSRLIMLTLPGISSDSELATHYRNQPFFFLALEYVRNLAGADPKATLSEAYKILDLLSLVIFVGVVFAFIRSLETSFIVKIFAGLLLLAGAGSQLFFGYIENYAPGYALTAAYVTTGWLAMQKKISLIIPLLCFMLIVGLHTGAFVFIPSLIILLYFAWREKKRGAMIIGILVVAVVLLVESSTHNNLYQFGLRLLAVAKDDFLPLVTTTPDTPYTIFSWVHFIDWMNLHMLIAPFGLLITIVILFFARRSLDFKNPGFLFLLTAALCGLFFSFALGSAIGLFRDWDLMAGFLIPLMFLSVYLLCQTLQKVESRKIIFVMAIVTVIHTAAWIGVNSNIERHLRRAEILTNTRFLGRFAQMLYYGQLANAFWDTKDYPRAKTWNERYLTLDSSNPRFLANLADACMLLGEREEYFSALKRAVAANSRDHRVYENLSAEYMARRDTAAAIECGERAVAKDSASGPAHYNLAVYYCASRNYLLADRHFAAANALGIREPDLYRLGGAVCVMLKKYERALQYYTLYLEMVPGDKRIREIRGDLNASLSASTKKR